MRAGKPCAMGSGWPFMPTASSALGPCKLGPSMMAATGVEMVIPSVEVDRTWFVPAFTPALRSSPASGTPSHLALPL